MPLRPDDVVRKSFTTSILRRGYDEKQVDAFLEEVVAELRRLYGRIDALEADAAAVAARTPADEMSERVHREQQQVDLIRAERQDLVTELAGAQSRFDRLVQESEAAEERARAAEAAAEKAETTKAEVLEQLGVAEEKLLRAQAEYDETVSAQERVAVELRMLRVAAEQRAEGALPELTLPAGQSPQEDMDAILAVSRALHDDYVQAGLDQAEQVRSEAASAAEQLLSTAADQARRQTEEAQTAHDNLIEAAKAQQARFVADGSQTREKYMMEGQQGRDKMLSEARAEHQRLIEEATAEHARLLGEGQSENERLIWEAKAEHARLLGEGQTEHQRLISEATSEHARLSNDGQVEHRRLIDEAKAEHQRLISEAEEQRAGILADLNARREHLEQRLHELDRSQGEYRDRLRALVQQQLSALEDEGWRS